VYGVAALSYALTRHARVDRPAVDLQVSLVRRSTACALDAPAAVVLTATGTTGCDTAPVSAGWTGKTARRCPDTSCLVLAAYRRDAHGDLRRRAWRVAGRRGAGRRRGRRRRGTARVRRQRLAAGHCLTTGRLTT